MLLIIYLSLYLSIKIYHVYQISTFNWSETYFISHYIHMKEFA